MVFPMEITAENIATYYLVEAMDKTIAKGRGIKLKKALLHVDLMEARTYGFENARDILRLYVKKFIKHGHRTRCGKVHEKIHAHVLRQAGWSVSDNLPEKSKTDLIVSRDAKTYLVNIKTSASYGNSADRTAELMRKFRMNRKVKVDGVPLAEVANVEVLIGSLATEKTHTFIAPDGVPVHHQFGHYFATFFGIDPAIACYDQDAVFQQIDKERSFRHEVIAIIEDTVERLYQELMSNGGKFRGCQIIHKHDIIIKSELEKVRIKRPVALAVPRVRGRKTAKLSMDTPYFDFA